MTNPNGGGRSDDPRGGRQIPIRRAARPGAPDSGESGPRGSAEEVLSRGSRARPGDDDSGGGAPAFRVNDRRWWAQAPSGRHGFDGPDPAADGATDPGEGSDDADVPTYVGKLESEIARLSALVDEKDRAARSQAVAARGALDEIERAKARLRAESERTLEQRRRAVLVGFLEVLDDLDRALASARETEPESAVTAGVELVRKRFLAKLGEFGVAHAPAMGERFDPAVHEALAAVPVSDPRLAGAIVGVIREGYRIGDEVLRPAGVAVGKG